MHSICDTGKVKLALLLLTANDYFLDMRMIDEGTKIWHILIIICQMVRGNKGEKKTLIFLDIKCHCGYQQILFPDISADKLLLLGTKRFKLLFVFNVCVSALLL